eukprot:3294518-Rhodomonas_salina.1
MTLGVGCVVMRCAWCCQSNGRAAACQTFCELEGCREEDGRCRRQGGMEPERRVRRWVQVLHSLSCAVLRRRRGLGMDSALPRIVLRACYGMPGSEHVSQADHHHHRRSATPICLLHDDTAPSPQKRCGSPQRCRGWCPVLVLTSHGVRRRRVEAARQPQVAAQWRHASAAPAAQGELDPAFLEHSVCICACLGSARSSEADRWKRGSCCRQASSPLFFPSAHRAAERQVSANMERHKIEAVMDLLVLLAEAGADVNGIAHPLFTSAQDALADQHMDVSLGALLGSDDEKLKLVREFVVQRHKGKVKKDLAK